MIAASLRKRLRRARRQLSKREQREHAERAALLLARSHLARGDMRIALYKPCNGEIDPEPIRQRLPGHHDWYLPVLRRHAHGRLWFVRDAENAPMRENRFGIPEPSRRRRQLAPTHGLDLIIVPLVGFDRHCNRIGMGGGYYDRSLAFLRTRQHWLRPRLVGLAHECQRVDLIEPQPWDISLDAVVTEQAIYQRPLKRGQPAPTAQAPRSHPANRR
jgi:5-formyltetrahydrofolate cyclo-ligase